MQFNSIDFMMFFPVVTTVYFFAPRKGRLPWLLAASYYFYMSWNPKYALLMLFSTVATWFCSLALERRSGVSYRRTVLVLCLLANLAILGFFKYANFALETLDALAHVMGFSGGDVQRRFSLLLPVGISFYTFQALGYIIDVYRGGYMRSETFCVTPYSSPSSLSWWRGLLNGRKTCWDRCGTWSALIFGAGGESLLARC